MANGGHHPKPAPKATEAKPAQPDPKPKKTTGPNTAGPKK